MAYNVFGAAAKGGAAALLLVAVCACSHQEAKPTVEENAFPADYRSQIARQVHIQFDNQTLRDGAVAEPALKTTGSATRYVSCVRFTAADSQGAAKARSMAAYFYAGKITQVVDAGPELSCDRAAFAAVPELSQSDGRAQDAKQDAKQDANANANQPARR